MLIEPLLTPQQAAEALGNISVATLYSWVYRRKIPYQKVGRLLRFSPTALARWLETQGRLVEVEPAAGEGGSQQKGPAA